VVIRGRAAPTDGVQMFVVTSIEEDPVPPEPVRRPRRIVDVRQERLPLEFSPPKGADNG
jgi:hypothetical protein